MEAHKELKGGHLELTGKIVDAFFFHSLHNKKLTS
jgi:hypothetical protein